MALQFKADLRLQSSEAFAEFQRDFKAALGGAADAAQKVNKALGGKEIFQVEVRYNSSGDAIATGQKLFTAVNQVKQKQKELNKIQKNSLSNLRGRLRYYTQIRDRINRTTVAVGKNGKAVEKVNKRWQAMEERIRRINILIAKQKGDTGKAFMLKIPGGDKIMNVANKLTQLSFAAQGVQMAIQAMGAAIGPIIQRAKQLKGMEMAFQGIGLTAEESSQFIKMAKVQALQFGGSLPQIEKGYKRIAPAILATGGSMKETSDVMAAIIARTTTLGLNSDQTSRYLEAFAQVMGKGKLQGEELTQQFSELDGGLRAQVQAYFQAQKGIVDFDKAMQNGEISAGDFREAVIAISADMVNDLGGSVTEIQKRIDDLNPQQLQNIGDTLNNITLESLTETFGAFGKQMGATLVMIQKWIAHVATEFPFIQDLVKNFFRGLGAIIQMTVIGILGFFELVLKILETAIDGWYRIGGALEWIARRIGMGGMVDTIKGAMSDMMPNIMEATEGWMGLGDAIQDVSGDMSTMDGRIQILNNKLAQGKITLEEYNEAVRSMETMEQLKQDNLELEKMQQNIKRIKDQIKAGGLKVKVSKDNLATEKENLAALKRGIKQMYEDRLADVKKEQDAIKRRYDKEKMLMDVAKRQMDAMHDRQMQQLEARNNAIERAINSEISALEAKTPAERELAQLKEKEIMNKLKSKDLSKMERLELTAQLERMQRQKQVAEKQLELKAAQENAAKRQKALEEKQKQEKEEMAEAERKLAEDKKKALDEVKQKQEAIKEEQKEVNRAFEASKKVISVKGKSLGDILTLVKQQVTSVNQAKTAYDRTTGAVSKLKSELQKANQQAKQLQTNMQQRMQSLQKTTVTPGGNRFAGGPVTGGKTFTVNELGREGFMDRSGRMKEIKAPAWGQWKAPSTGTVIPAHIWSQIKAGNQSSAPTAIPTRGTQNAGLMAAIRSLNTGGSRDTVTNNVTIQSNNPRRDMVDALVTARRLKRVRHY